MKYYHIHNHLTFKKAKKPKKNILIKFIIFLQIKKNKKIKIMDDYYKINTKIDEK